MPQIFNILLVMCYHVDFSTFKLLTLIPFKANQRYIHYIMESAQYLYTDISTMNNFFNWTMTYRRDSDFYRPYGRIVKIKPHPEGAELEEYIKMFGKKNKHLAKEKKKHAAWFVSHCATQV